MLVARNTVVSLRVQMHDAQGVELQPAAELTYLHGGYGDGIAVGMEVEEDSRFYTVTDIAAGKVVLDANHPLAGMALRFSCQVLSVRTASQDEIRRRVSSLPA